MNSRRSAQKHGYSGKLVAFAELVGKARVRCSMRWAMGCGESEKRVIMAALMARPPLNPRVFLTPARSVFEPPQYLFDIMYGRKYYPCYCNADGSFRYGDFDTVEKIEAFARNRPETPDSAVDDYRLSARKHGYSGKLVKFVELLRKTNSVSILFAEEAMDCGADERHVVTAALGDVGEWSSPFICVPVTDPVSLPRYRACLPLGERYYLQHCNADGSFRYEDFDTVEKIEAFIGERRALYRAEHGIE